jgi:hypothetical protein
MKQNIENCVNDQQSALKKRKPKKPEKIKREG